MVAARRAQSGALSVRVESTVVKHVVVCVHVRQPFFSTLRIQPLHGCSVNVGHDLGVCESCHRVKSWTHILISSPRGDIQFPTSSAMTKNRGSAGLGKVCGAS